MGIAYRIFEIQIQNSLPGNSLIAAGGTVHVARAGTPDLETIYDVDSGLVVSNPLVPVRGRIRFATLATVERVDLYGIDAAGRFFVLHDVTAGGNHPEVYPNTGVEQVAVIPFSIANATANTERDTGFDLPLNATVLPMPLVRVTTPEAARTINVGLLSSGTGGNASGFVAGASLATAGIVVPSLATIQGAMLFENFATTPAVRVPRPHPLIGTNTRRVTYTLSTGTVAARGFMLLPYLRPMAA